LARDTDIERCCTTCHFLGERQERGGEDHRLAHGYQGDSFAAGQSNTICRDGQSTITAAIPFNDLPVRGAE
jgi:hypothetical protein